MPMSPPATPPPYQRNVNSSPASLDAISGITSEAQAKDNSFHVIYKVPPRESPYGIAKHVQIVEKDPDAAIPLFWAAINAGDRVDSALKDMAIVMKQQNRSQEAIEAIKSFRHRCSEQAQDSLDNVLIDLYKRCGRLDEQIALLKHKLGALEQNTAHNGKQTKRARCRGRKFRVSIQQEITRLLGNLGWAYMQQLNFDAAEAVYRKAQLMGGDGNRACNLALCLMKQGKHDEAIAILEAVVSTSDHKSDPKSLERAENFLQEIEDCCVKTRKVHSSLTTLSWEGGKCGGPSAKVSWDEWSYSDTEEEMNTEKGNKGGAEEWALGVSGGGEMWGGMARKRHRLPVFEDITRLKRRS